MDEISKGTLWRKCTLGLTLLPALGQMKQILFTMMAAKQKVLIVGEEVKLYLISHILKQARLDRMDCRTTVPCSGFPFLEACEKTPRNVSIPCEDRSVHVSPDSPRLHVKCHKTKLSMRGNSGGHFHWQDSGFIIVSRISIKEFWLEQRLMQLDAIWPRIICSKLPLLVSSWSR